MKIIDLHKKEQDIETMLQKAESFLAESDKITELKEVDELIAAYDEIVLIKDALRTGDFGILIGKQSQTLSHSDVFAIKRKISTIIRDNPIIDGDDIKRGRDGKEKVRALGRSIRFGLESIGLAIVSALFIYLSTLVAVPFAIALGNIAVLTGLASVEQARMVLRLKALAKLVDIVDAYGNLKPHYRISGFKRIFNVFMRRTPEEIEKSSRASIKKSSKKAKAQFDRLTKNLPDFIEYQDNEGNIQEYPLEKLFDV